MAPPFPQARILRNFEIIEANKWILRTVHHGQGNGKILDGPALICTYARTCSFKQGLSCETVRALYRASKGGG